MFERIVYEMTQGNFSFLIFVASYLQIGLMVVSLFFVIKTYKQSKKDATNIYKAFKKANKKIPQRKNKAS